MNKLNISIRYRILERDNYTCQYCGRKPPEVKLHIDHILPKSKYFNLDIDENLITTCQECNLGKRVTINHPFIKLAIYLYNQLKIYEQNNKKTLFEMMRDFDSFNG